MRRTTLTSRLAARAERKANRLEFSPTDVKFDPIKKQILLPGIGWVKADIGDEAPVGEILKVVVTQEAGAFYVRVQTLAGSVC
jgi:hypothetical protein